MMLPGAVLRFLQRVPGSMASSKSVITYPMLDMEIQNARRSLLLCRNCRSYALDDASWPGGIQGLRHVAALRRDIGPNHQK
jgi:hypothetical protein